MDIYRELVENFTGVIYTVDSNGIIEFVSPRVFELTGFHPHEVAGRHFSFLVEPEQLPAVYEHYFRQLKNRTRETTLEFKSVARGGQIKWVEQIAVLREKDSAVLGFQCFVRDISEKKRLQSELNQVEKRLEEHQHLMGSILDNTNAMIFVKDPAGRYLIANRRFYETFGRKEDDVLGQTDYSFCPQEQADHYRIIDEQVLAGGEVVAMEEVIAAPGGEIHLLVTKFAMRDNEQRIVGIGGIATDITERARYQQALVAAREEAENGRKMQEQFLANMSHEIRTPMNGIQGMTHLLRDTPLNAQQEEFVSLIGRSVENLLVVINDILDFSKIKAGKLTIEHIDFRLADVLDNIRMLFGPRVEAKNLQMTMETDKGIPEWLQGDPHRLNQVLINLVGNAVKFTAEGTIHIGVSIIERKAVQLVLGFLVSDEGIGIRSESLDTIFNPFEQAEAATTRKFGGTGLGLAICQQLLRLQGGEIGLSSQEGQGTKVSFTLPVGVAPPTVALRAPTFGQFEGVLAGYRFLVVEDNAINQKITEHVLRKAGGEVTITEDGEEAVRVLERERFDLIVMDLQMPVMDGYAATRHLRRVLKLDTPVLAMTASAIKGERLRCLEAGMTDYMSKPFEFADFYQRVMRMLEKKTDVCAAGYKDMAGIFDLTLLSDVGDEDYVRDIVQMYVSGLPGQVAELEAAISEADTDRLCAISHRLRSSTGMLKATAITDKLGRLERLVKEKEDGRSLVEELLPEFEQLRNGLLACLAAPFMVKK